MLPPDTDRLSFWEYEWLLPLLFDPSLISPTKCKWHEGCECYLPSHSPLITLWKGWRIHRGQNKFHSIWKTKEASQESSLQHNPVLGWWMLFPVSFDPVKYLWSDQLVVSSWWQLLWLGLWNLNIFQYLCQPMHGCCGWGWQAFPYVLWRWRIPDRYTFLVLDNMLLSTK